MIPRPDGRQPATKKQGQPRKGTSTMTPAERRMEAARNRIHQGQINETNANLAAQRNGGGNKVRSANTGSAAKPAKPVKAAAKLDQSISGRDLVKKIRKGDAKNSTKAQAAAKVAAKGQVSGSRKPVRGGNGGSKGAGKVRGGGSGAPKIGGGKGSSVAPATTGSNAYRTKAEAAVALMLDPKIKALQGQAEDLSSEYTQQKGQLATDTNRQLGDLGEVYKRLDNMLGTYAQQSDTAYNNAAQQQSAGFQQLQDRLAAQGQQATSGANAELNRLGIQGTDQSRLQADQAFAQDTAANNRAMAAATLQTLQANAQNFNQAQRGIGQQAGAQAQTTARQAAADQLYELLNNRNQGVHAVNRDITNTQGQRGSLIQQMMDQYEQQAYERQMEAQQQAFMNGMNVNEFNLKSDQFNADQAYRQAQLALDGQKLQQGAAAKTTKNGGYGTGFKGAQQYFGQNMTDAGRKAALTAIMQKIDTHAQNTSRPGDDWSQGSPTDVGKALHYAYKMLRQPGFRRYYGPRSKSLLKSALDVYFGKA